ncbi:MAG: tRNA-dihydrouridine synthase family protein [Opitutaceae bacterium]|jgi:tRNA-dihydrouridine synthase
MTFVSLPPCLVPGQPLTALAPMQDVTDLSFMRVIARFGAPDYFFTEFFRVHPQSTPERHILRSIDENDTGRPVFAQLIGENIRHLERTIAELLKHPIAGIDLNLGCPAPKVYKKNVGGGLLREPARIAEILCALREIVPGLFTVKMRLGFEDTAHFEEVLDLIDANRVDLLSVHGRVVKQMYRGDVRYDLIGAAVGRVRCPVLANGEISSASKACAVLAGTKAAGVMIGRHAVRNPWIFAQIRARLAGEPVAPVTLADVRGYVELLYRSLATPEIPEKLQVARIKKFLNFVGQSVDPQGAFLRDMRRAATEKELFAICDRHLMAEPSRHYSDEPYPGVVARPNCEDCCLGT